MKKYLLLILFSIFIISCSKKETIITGKINNHSPLGRIEIIDVSSIDTLPIANFGFDENGNFSDTIKIEKNGVYVIVYQGRANHVYLQKGKNIHFTGNGSTFPEDIKITGEGQSNNEFLIESQKFTNEYLSKLSTDIFAKEEGEFIKEMEKYATDINKKVDEIAKSKKADNEVIQWKKNDLLVNLLIIGSQYELMHGNLTGKTDFKVSAKFTDLKKKLEKDSFIKDYPAYRQYLLGQLQNDFRKFATPYLEDTKITQTEVFFKFLDTQNQLSQETKDYLSSFLSTQLDLYPQNPKAEQAMKALQEKVKSEKIKKDLENVYAAIAGLKKGTTAPEGSLTKQDGKPAQLSEFKGKPTLLVFYSSFASGMVESIAPALKEISDFYKEKMNFVYINMDDDAKQFQKTSQSLMKDIVGINIYAKGGLKSDIAKKFHIYGFKLPSFVVLDKDGKIASNSILGLTPDLIEILNKQTGLQAPTFEAEMKSEELHHEHDGHGH